MARAFPGFPARPGHSCAVDSGLAGAARGLLQNCIATASWRAYASGQAHYQRFCERYAIPAVPATADTIVYYLADLKRSGVATGTAKQRLAAVRHLHLRYGMGFPAGSSPLVQAALRGYPARGGGHERPARRGVTVDQLRALKTGLGTYGSSYFNQRCIWAACAVAFYGGMRASEYLLTRESGLRRTSITFSQDGSECVIELRIQKNRQFGPPVSVHLPATGTSTCPVRALQMYCRLRDERAAGDAALFVLETGAPLTRRSLSTAITKVLGEGYSTHSPRIGLATAAAVAEGVADTTIQMLGRWQSNAYQGYVRGHRSRVSAALRTIARSNRRRLDRD